jgi:hypothetical protein
MHTEHLSKKWSNGVLFEHSKDSKPPNRVVNVSLLLAQLIFLVFLFSSVFSSEFSWLTSLMAINPQKLSLLG